MATKSTTSPMVFMRVVIVPPKVTESSLVGVCCALAPNFDGGALALVLCDHWPFHDEPSDPRALVVPSHGG
eukprot:8283288-Prorocentrum_lima.AAC.1